MRNVVCPKLHISNINKIVSLVVVLLLPFFLTGCTLKDLPVIGKFFGGNGTASKQVTLNVWGMFENPEVVDVAVKKFQEKNPNVKVNYEDRSLMNPNDYKDAVFSRAAQSGAPDVVLVHNTWALSLKPSLYPMPSKMMSAQDYSQKFYPVASESAVEEGKIYAIPSYYDGLALVYNVKHFDAIDQKSAPTSWEEFRTLATKLTVKNEKGEVVRAGAAIGTANNIDFASDIYGLLLAQVNTNYPKQLDSVPSQDALSFYTTFVKKDGVWNESFPEASTAFSREQVSMIFIPSWNLLDILAARPDLQVGVAPVPQAIAENPITWGSFWMYAVPSAAANKDTAWEFINFLAEEESQLAMFNEASKFRKYGSPYSLVNLSSQLSSQSYLKPYVDTAPYAKSYDVAARSGNRKQVDAIKEAINAVLEGQTPAVALRTAKQKISQSN